MSLLTAALSLFNPAPAISQTPAFSDDFSTGKLDTSKWNVMTYASPGSKPGVNDGKYSADMLDFSTGMLRIGIKQEKGPNGVVSTGGGIYSKERFGYGTYVFVMRQTTTSPTPDGAGKTITGAVSSGFIYFNKSETEVDLEFLGNENAIHITTWKNPTPTQEPRECNVTNKVNNKFLGTQFRTMTLVWNPTEVKVWIDKTLVVTHKTHVPSTPAHIILQHRGVNDNNWGGAASVGVNRYFFVKSVTFTPMGK
jgi:hypothetical protein